MDQRRPKSLCWSIDIFWSRKKITRLSISVVHFLNCWLPGGLPRSTPNIPHRWWARRLRT